MAVRASLCTLCQKVCFHCVMKSWTSEASHAFWCNRRVSVCVHSGPKIKKNKLWETTGAQRNLSKSKNAKSILLQKVLHKVFRGEKTSGMSQKHSGACLQSEMDCVFEVAPSIKTHSCSFSPFISARAIPQIIVLIEHYVLFTEWILGLPFILTCQIAVQLAHKLKSSLFVPGIHLFWTQISVTGLTGSKVHILNKNWEI